MAYQLFIMKIPERCHPNTIIIAGDEAMVQLYTGSKSVKLVMTKQPRQPEDFPLIVMGLVKYPAEFKGFMGGIIRAVHIRQRLIRVNDDGFSVSRQLNGFELIDSLYPTSLNLTSRFIIKCSLEGDR